MNFRKKLMAFLLALVMVISMLPVSVLATEGETTVVQEEVVAENPIMTVAETATYEIMDGVVITYSTLGRFAERNGAWQYRQGNTGTDTVAAQLTLTNTTGNALSFMFEVNELVSNFKVDGTAPVGNTVTVGESAVITFDVLADSDLSGQITFSDFREQEATEGNITFVYDSAYGEVTMVNGEETIVLVSGTAYTVPASGVTLNATAKNGASFLLWANGDDDTLISNSSSFTFTPGGQKQINVAFAHKDADAWFRTGGSKDTQHYVADLDKASDYAVASNNKTVLLISDGALKKSATIDSGVTLHIPYDAANSIPSNRAEPTQSSNDNLKSITESVAFRTLTLKSGVNLTVQGELMVGGTVFACGARDTTTPHGPYGLMVLESSSQLIITGKAYCYGFIMGTHDSAGNYTGGTVVAQSGATVYELFQVRDMRGRAVTQASENKQTFPITQYYVQNIEAKYEVNQGAYSKAVIRAANLTGMTPCETFDFLGASGLFRITSGKIIRQYHPIADRVVYDFEGTISVDSIVIDLSIKKLDSSKFYLGVNGNMTVNVKSGSTTINQKLKLLPGAELNIASGAEATVSGSGAIILFDKDHWVTSFAYYPATTNISAADNNGIAFNNAGTSAHVVRYSPTREAVKGAAVTPTYAGAKLRVDGKLTANGNVFSTTGYTKPNGETVTGTVVDNVLSGTGTYINKAAYSNLTLNEFWGNDDGSIATISTAPLMGHVVTGTTVSNRFSDVSGKVYYGYYHEKNMNGRVDAVDYLWSDTEGLTTKLVKLMDNGKVIGSWNTTVYSGMDYSGYFSDAACTTAATADAAVLYVTAQGEACIVNSVGVQMYDTLKEAINAAGYGDTVKLLKNIDIGASPVVIDKDKTIHLDLNNHSITGTNHIVINRGKLLSLSGGAMKDEAGNDLPAGKIETTGISDISSALFNQYDNSGEICVGQIELICGNLELKASGPAQGALVNAGGAYIKQIGDAGSKIVLTAQDKTLVNRTGAIIEVLGGAGSKVVLTAQNITLENATGATIEVLGGAGSYVEITQNTGANAYHKNVVNYGTIGIIGDTNAEVRITQNFEYTGGGINPWVITNEGTINAIGSTGATVLMNQYAASGVGFALRADKGVIKKIGGADVKRVEIVSSHIPLYVAGSGTVEEIAANTLFVAKAQFTSQAAIWNTGTIKSITGGWFNSANKSVNAVFRTGDNKLGGSKPDALKSITEGYGLIDKTVSVDSMVTGNALSCFAVEPVSDIEARNEAQARIDNIYYCDAKSAISASRSGDTMTLLKDVSYTGHGFYFEHDDVGVTLNLNNHSVTAVNYALLNRGEISIYGGDMQDAAGNDLPAGKLITTGTNQYLSGSIYNQRYETVDGVLKEYPAKIYSIGGNLELIDTNGGTIGVIYNYGGDIGTIGTEGGKVVITGPHHLLNMSEGATLDVLGAAGTVEMTNTTGWSAIYLAGSPGDDQTTIGQIGAAGTVTVKTAGTAIRSAGARIERIGGENAKVTLDNTSGTNSDANNVIYVNANGSIGTIGSTGGGQVKIDAHYRGILIMNAAGNTVETELEAISGNVEINSPQACLYIAKDNALGMLGGAGSRIKLNHTSGTTDGAIYVAGAINTFGYGEDCVVEVSAATKGIVMSGATIGVLGGKDSLVKVSSVTDAIVMSGAAIGVLGGENSTVELTQTGTSVFTLNLSNATITTIGDKNATVKIIHNGELSGHGKTIFLDNKSSITNIGVADGSKVLIDQIITNTKTGWAIYVQASSEITNIGGPNSKVEIIGKGYPVHITDTSKLGNITGDTLMVAKQRDGNFNDILWVMAPVTSITGGYYACANSYNVADGIFTDDILATIDTSGYEVSEVTVARTSEITGETYDCYYLLAKHEHTFTAEPTVTWETKDGKLVLSAAGKCDTEGCVEELIVAEEAEVSYETIDNIYRATYSATVEFNGKTYTDSQIEDIEIAGTKTMKYDDRVIAEDIRILEAGKPTSKKVGSDELDDAVLTAYDNMLVATGIGEGAKVIIDGKLYDVTVEKAVIDLFMITGHSLGMGSRGTTEESVVIDDGSAYSFTVTNTDNGPTSYRYTDLIPAWEDVGLGYAAENRPPEVDNFTTEGGGVIGEDSGLAWKWNQLTGHKVYVVNSAVGSTSMYHWYLNTSNDSNKVPVLTNAIQNFTYARYIIQNEVDAGHFEMGNMALINHNGANFTTADWSTIKKDWNNEEGEGWYAKVLGDICNAMDIDWDGDGTVEAGETMSIGFIPNWSETNGASWWADRPASQFMGVTADSEYAHMFTVSLLGREWNSDSSVVAYFNGYTTPFTIHSGKEPVYPTSLSSVYADGVHYVQSVYNVIGMDLAENLKEYFYPTVADENVTLKLYKTDGVTEIAAEGTGDLTISVGEKLVLVPVAEPITANEFTFETDGALGMTYPLTLCGNEVGEGTLTISYKGRVVKTVKVTVDSGEARIGEMNYATLKQAIAAAQVGDTVTLLKDIDVGSVAIVIGGDKEIHLDLNNHSITGTNHILINRGRLLSLSGGALKDAEGNVLDAGMLETTGATGVASALYNQQTSDGVAYVGKIDLICGNLVLKSNGSLSQGALVNDTNAYIGQIGGEGSDIQVISGSYTLDARAESEIGTIGNGGKVTFTQTNIEGGSGDKVKYPFHVVGKIGTIGGTNGDVTIRQTNNLESFSAAVMITGGGSIGTVGGENAVVNIIQNDLCTTASDYRIAIWIYSDATIGTLGTAGTVNIISNGTGVYMGGNNTGAKVEKVGTAGTVNITGPVVDGKETACKIGIGIGGTSTDVDIGELGAGGTVNINASDKAIVLWAESGSSDIDKIATAGTVNIISGNTGITVLYGSKINTIGAGGNVNIETVGTTVNVGKGSVLTTLGGENGVVTLKQNATGGVAAKILDVTGTVDSIGGKNATVKMIMTSNATDESGNGKLINVATGGVINNIGTAEGSKVLIDQTMTAPASAQDCGWAIYVLGTVGTIGSDDSLVEVIADHCPVYLGGQIQKITGNTLMVGKRDYSSSTYAFWMATGKTVDSITGGYYAQGGVTIDDSYVNYIFDSANQTKIIGSGYEINKNVVERTSETTQETYKCISVREVHEHSYGEPVFVWNGNTATATITCAECNNDAAEKTKAVEVTMSNETLSEGDCQKPASIQYTATAVVDGVSYTDTKTVESELGDHVLVITEAKAASCNEPGNNEYYTCSVDGCGKVFKSDKTTETSVEAETLKALGHKYGEPQFFWNATEQEATCSALFTCTVCEEGTSGRTTCKDAEVGVIKNVAATCVQAGSKTYQATVSFEGESYSEQKVVEIPETGHGSIKTEYVRIEDTFTHSVTEICGVCGNPAAEVTTEDCADGDANGSCDKCGGAIAASDVLYGDADGDGEVTSKDATYVLQYVVNIVTEIDSVAADVDGDGEVTSKDATEILQFIVNIIPEFTVQSKH